MDLWTSLPPQYSTPLELADVTPLNIVKLIDTELDVNKTDGYTEEKDYNKFAMGIAPERVTDPAQIAEIQNETVKQCGVRLRKAMRQLSRTQAERDKNKRGRTADYFYQELYDM